MNKKDNCEHKSLVKTVRKNLLTRIRYKQISWEILSEKTGYTKKVLKRALYKEKNPGICILFSIADVLNLKYSEIFEKKEK